MKEMAYTYTSHHMIIVVHWPNLTHSSV